MVSAYYSSADINVVFLLKMLEMTTLPDLLKSPYMSFVLFLLSFSICERLHTKIQLLAILLTSDCRYLLQVSFYNLQGKGHR